MTEGHDVDIGLEEGIKRALSLVLSERRGPEDPNNLNLISGSDGIDVAGIEGDERDGGGRFPLGDILVLFLDLNKLLVDEETAIVL